MAKIMDALDPLDPGAKHSVLDWIDAQIGRSKSASSAGHSKSATEEEKPRIPSGGVRPGTVSTVAQKLGANSCRTLLVAAAAHLTLYQAKDSFTRDELIACAKGARGWKAEYSNQMATAITRLQDSAVLFEKSKDVFSLSDASLADMESKLAAG
jgi:hypothetical protein